MKHPIIERRKLERKATSRTALTFLLITMLTMPFNVNLVVAYKSGTNATHQFIFEQARTILRNDGYVSYEEFLDSVEPFSGLTYLAIMIKGSDENDALIAAREHYLDPMDHKGLLLLGSYQKSAGTLCQERFNEAVAQWQNGNYYNAMYNLGWAAHLVQDVCVPHHAWTTYSNWHSEYEDWVKNNGYLYAVSSGGTYSLPSFMDLQYYTPKHYSGVNISAYDWVDHNAHESIKYFLYVNSNTASYIIDAAAPYVETIHPLPDNLATTRVITAYQTNGLQLHFEKIDMENSHDYIYIYDKYDNLLDVYTGQYNTDFWTPWYSSGDTLKIKVTTDSSFQSWGYKIKEVKYYDLGEDLHEATSVLFPRAQRTTAGFIKFFFDTVLKTIYIRLDGSVDPPEAPIQRNGSIFTFLSSIDKPIVVEKDDIIIYGNGHRVQGRFDVGDGLYLSGRSNVTVQNTTIEGFWSGIFIWNSTKITIENNVIVNNSYGGIGLHNSSNNDLIGNEVSNNSYGIGLFSGSKNNLVFHNNFINNTIQTYVDTGYTNSWDNGYPSGGNYWSGFTDVDLNTSPHQNITGGDGIWDHPYGIDANNQDKYPLTNPWTPLKGDTDGDWDVDSADLHTFSRAYGTRLEEPNYHTRAEVDQDGDVDIYDLYTLARNYGKTEL